MRFSIGPSLIIASIITSYSFAKGPSGEVRSMSCYGAIAKMLGGDTRTAYNAGPDFTKPINSLKTKAPKLFPAFNELAHQLSQPTMDNWSLGKSAGKAADAMLADLQAKQSKNAPGHTLAARLPEQAAEWEAATNKQISSLAQWEDLQYRSTFSLKDGKIQLAHTGSPKIEISKRGSDVFVKFGNMPETVLDPNAAKGSHAEQLRSFVLETYSSNPAVASSPLIMASMNEGNYFNRMQLHQKLFYYLRGKLAVPEQRALTPEQEKAFNASYYSLRALEAGLKANRDMVLPSLDGDQIVVNRWSATADGMSHLMTNEMFTAISNSALRYAGNGP